MNARAVLRAGAAYFGWVFAAGFALGMIRVPLLVPRVGVRTAELLEMPLMLAVMLWAARRVGRGVSPALTRAERLAAGVIALGLLLAAESALVLAQGQRLAGYVAARDPVSGGVYAAMLLLLAALPALMNNKEVGHAQGQE